ncbi:MAG TPA: TIGR03118 family protein, partial [Mycobacterium sp.]|nr:TIGR03118 family protein [Mycobacterium sp.]
MSDTVSLSDFDLNEHHHHHNEDHHHGRLSFIQTNLIADPTLSAQLNDPNLINPWGVSFSSSSPFWISDNGTGLTSIDSVDSSGNVTLNRIPAVTIPTPDGTGTSAPTGQVFNSFSSDKAFTLSHKNPATFLFATEDGTIAGWNVGDPNNPNTTAITVVDNSTAGPNGGAVYKGLAIANSDYGPTLYATNFRDGTVDMFDQNFNQIGSFSDPCIPDGFAPFNVQVLDDKLYVTYAKQDDAKHDDVAGKGNGFVDVFDLDGNL